MKKSLLYCVILPLLASCSLFFRQNNQYATDYHALDDKERAQKYLTLYGHQKLDFSVLRKNEAYLAYGNNNSFQILVFSDNGFVYHSPSMDVSLLGKPFAMQKLLKNGIFSIEGTIFKRETVAAHPGSVYSIIDEGVIRNDTIFMQKSYQTKGSRNEHQLLDEFVPLPKIKVLKLGDDLFIESKG
jgi:hypothetical protein